jgi:hypothetical protein
VTVGCGIAKCFFVKPGVTAIFSIRPVFERSRSNYFVKNNFLSCYVTLAYRNSCNPLSMVTVYDSKLVKSIVLLGTAHIVIF